MSVGCNGSHMSFFISRYAVGIIDLMKCLGSLETVVHNDRLHAARCSDIVVTVRCADYASNRIGRKSARLIKNINHFFTDHDRKSVVIRSDPQTAFLINVQTVDVLDGIVIVDPPELFSVIPIQPGVGSDPQYTVIGLRDIVGFSARKSVITAVYALDIIVIIRRFGLRGCSACGIGDRKSERDAKCKNDTGGTACLDLSLFFLFLLVPMHPSHEDDNVYRSDCQYLIRKLDCELSQYGARKHGPSLFEKVVNDSVSPPITRITFVKEEIDRDGHNKRRQHCKRRCLHESVELVEPSLTCRYTDYYAYRNTRYRVRR